MSAVAGWEQRIAEQAQQYQQLSDHVAQVALTETSRDGMVQVTVSANGTLTGLVLRERGQPRPLPQVAAEIMHCVRRAQARIPGLLQASLASTVCEHDPAAQQIVADARTRFPEPPPPPPRSSTMDDMRAAPRPVQPPPLPMPPARPPVPRHGPEDDDWDGRSLMEDV